MDTTQLRSLSQPDETLRMFEPTTGLSTCGLGPTACAAFLCLAVSHVRVDPVLMRDFSDEPSPARGNAFDCRVKTSAAASALALRGHDAAARSAVSRGL